MKREFRENKYQKWVREYNIENNFCIDIKDEGIDTINFYNNGVFLYQEWKTVLAYACVKKISFFKMLDDIIENVRYDNLAWI